MPANTIFSNDSLNKIFYRSRGFGFITFKNAESVDAVQANRPHEIDGRSTETKRAMPREVNMSPGLQIRVCTGKLLFLLLSQNICCGYSKEPSQ